MEIRGKMSGKLYRRGDLWRLHFDEFGNFVSQERDKVLAKVRKALFLSKSHTHPALDPGRCSSCFVRSPIRQITRGLLFLWGKWFACFFLGSAAAGKRRRRGFQEEAAEEGYDRGVGKTLHSRLPSWRHATTKRCIWLLGLKAARQSVGSVDGPPHLQCRSPQYFIQLHPCRRFQPAYSRPVVRYSKACSIASGVLLAAPAGFCFFHAPDTLA